MYSYRGIVNDLLKEFPEISENYEEEIAYHSDTKQAADIENEGDWQHGFLLMHHKDYSFLQYEIACCCSSEQGTACY